MIEEKIDLIMSEIGALKKDAKNPYYNSSYTSLNQVLDQLKPKLKEHKLSLVQYPSYELQGEKTVLFLQTVLTDLGDDDKLAFRMPLQGVADMQKLGSAITYARRYSLVTLFQLESEDDDGNATVKKTDPFSEGVG